MSSDIEIETGRKITPYQIWVLLALTVLNMQDGFDILAISFAATAITEEWNISRASLGVVFSAGLFGMMVIKSDENQSLLWAYACQAWVCLSLCLRLQ